MKSELEEAKKLLKIQSKMMKQFSGKGHSLSPLTELERLQCFDSHLVIESFFEHFNKQ